MCWGKIKPRRIFYILICFSLIFAVCLRNIITKDQLQLPIIRISANPILSASITNTSANLSASITNTSASPRDLSVLITRTSASPRDLSALVTRTSASPGDLSVVNTQHGQGKTKKSINLDEPIFKFDVVSNKSTGNKT